MQTLSNHHKTRTQGQAEESTGIEPILTDSEYEKLISHSLFSEKDFERMARYEESKILDSE